MSRRAVLAGLLLGLGGCASTPREFAEPPLGERERLAVRRIAVVASRVPPEAYDFTQDPYTQLDGAREGVQEGLANGLLACAELGVLCVYFAPILVPALVVGSAMVGAATTPEYAGDAAVSEVQARAREAADALRLELRDAVGTALARNTGYEVVTGSFPGPLQMTESDAHAALPHGFDAILSVRLIAVDPYWRGRKIGAELALNAELLDGTGRRLALCSHSARTERRRIENWSDAALREAIRRARNLVAADLIDELFLIAHMPGDPVEVGRGYLLEPGARLGQARASLEPETFLERAQASHGAMRSATRWRHLEASRRFEWERFEERWAKRPLFDAPLEHVSYDFRIFSARMAMDRWGPEVLVYQRKGLAEPHHTPEVELAACERYFWSVRARFRAGGRARVTEWAGPLRYEAEATRRRAYLLFGRWGYAFVRLPPSGRSGCPDLRW